VYDILKIFFCDPRKFHADFVCVVSSGHQALNLWLSLFILQVQCGKCNFYRRNVRKQKQNIKWFIILLNTKINQTKEIYLRTIIKEQSLLIEYWARTIHV